MLITDEIWCDEWFCSLEQRQKLLYLYLLGNCSKCGIFELNMRKINFDLSNGTERVRPYTAKEILTFIFILFFSYTERFVSEGNLTLAALGNLKLALFSLLHKYPLILIR